MSLQDSSDADLPASFTADQRDTVSGPQGQLVHRESLKHSARFRRKLWTIRPGVWCLVGNGLSNQTFVEGPDGVIAIDTGECVEEMQAALAALATVTDAPVVAAIYTHSHYVGGTAALPDGLPIWGHEGIVDNLRHYGAEFSAVAGRGLVHQFGMTLPADGPDGIVNVGLGMSFRNHDHAPFTPGFIEPNRVIVASTAATIAGLKVEFEPAPSDANDSLTVWFPDLDLAVNNLVWPALFNVFAIRGEQYRDPRTLLSGLDHLLALRPVHLAGTHGPPLTGRDHIQRDVLQYRDAIQFLWDQTVRGINKGYTVHELTRLVQLPDFHGDSYLTQQLYGLVEHHVHQIHDGLRGWFDGDESQLFPLHPVDRAQRIIEGFGGAGRVRELASGALASDDLRWALELASMLVRSGEVHDRPLLADVLRTIGQRSTAANIRNWCLTRARDLEGLDDLSRFREHRFNVHQVLASPPSVFVDVLRVLLDPERAKGLDMQLRWEFPSGDAAALHIRNQVAVPVDGRNAADSIQVDAETWAAILAHKRTIADAVGTGDLKLAGRESEILRFLACFDHRTLGDAARLLPMRTVET